MLFVRVYCSILAALMLLAPPLLTCETVEPATLHPTSSHPPSSHPPSPLTARPHTPTPPPLVERPRAPTPPTPADQIVGFTKRLYSALAHKRQADVVAEFQPEYNTINDAEDWTLPVTLGALSEMRISDLQTSVLHAKEMQRVLDLLASAADGGWGASN
jgi:hypothetical protein